MRIVAAAIVLALLMVAVTSHTRHGQPVPSPARHDTTTAPARPVPTTPAPVGSPVIDGEVDDYGPDPWHADCAGPRLVDVHPDTPAHRAIAAHDCAQSDQDWQTLESVAMNGGDQR